MDSAAALNRSNGIPDSMDCPGDTASKERAMLKPRHIFLGSLVGVFFAYLLILVILGDAYRPQGLASRSYVAARPGARIVELPAAPRTAPASLEEVSHLPVRQAKDSLPEEPRDVEPDGFAAADRAMPEHSTAARPAVLPLLPDLVSEETVEEVMERLDLLVPLAVAAAGKIGSFVEPPGKAEASGEALEESGTSQRPEPAGEAIAESPAMPEWMHRLPDVMASVPKSLRPTEGDDNPLSDLSYPHTEDDSYSPTQSAPKPGRTTRRADDSWYQPETLIASLHELVSAAPSRQWASEVLHELQALQLAVVGKNGESTKHLERLVELERQTPHLASTFSDKMLAKKLRRAGYALERRMDIWREVAQLGVSSSAEAASPDRDAQRLANCLAEVEALTADSDIGAAWRSYLLLETLKECVARGPSAEDPLAQEVFRKALRRMSQMPLSPQQREFVSTGPVADLQTELRRWTTEPVGTASLLRAIERYERTGLPSDARRLADKRQTLSCSLADGRRQLAERVDAHYRNANLRIAVTEKLLNQLIPEQNLEYSRVRDTVQGRPVHGESLMATEISVRLLPDPTRVRLALEVRGEISSLTTADAGPARIHNDTESYYVARKPLEITMKGIRVWPVEIGVENTMRVRSVQTPLDGVPVIGAVLKGVAKSQVEQSKPAANEEVRQKIAARATERIDAEARKQLSAVVERMNKRVFDPLNALMLDPELIGAETTEERFTMRLRVGGEDQLGSHTPRPQAPSDSLASVQLHESVLNNGIQRLELEGRTFTLPELSQHIARQLKFPSPWETNPENEDVKITFADQDAVVVRCQDGQFVLTLSIRSLSKGPRRWNDFDVRAFYRPEVSGRSAQLVREGVIHLIGQRLSAGSQIALRGIFSRVFSRKTPWELVPEQIAKSAQLKDLAITQCVIDDGWIGVSLGPKRSLGPTARRLRWGTP